MVRGDSWDGFRSGYLFSPLYLYHLRYDKFTSVQNNISVDQKGRYDARFPNQNKLPLVMFGSSPIQLLKIRLRRRGFKDSSVYFPMIL